MQRTDKVKTMPGESMISAGSAWAFEDDENDDFLAPSARSLRPK